MKTYNKYIIYADYFLGSQSQIFSIINKKSMKIKYTYGFYGKRFMSVDFLTYSDSIKEKNLFFETYRKESIFSPDTAFLYMLYSLSNKHGGKEFLIKQLESRQDSIKSGTYSYAMEKDGINLVSIDLKKTKDKDKLVKLNIIDDIPTCVAALCLFSLLSSYNNYIVEINGTKYYGLRLNAEVSHSIDTNNLFFSKHMFLDDFYKYSILNLVNKISIFKGIKHKLSKKDIEDYFDTVKINFYDYSNINNNLLLINIGTLEEILGTELTINNTIIHNAFKHDKINPCLEKYLSDLMNIF